MKIIADNTIPYLKGVIETIADVEYLSSGQFTAAAIKDADVLIVRSVDKCTREVLEGSRVKLITTATIGYDHIDTAYCDSVGITWKNAPGSNAVSVAQYILACLVTLSLRTGQPLKGKTIGIIGVGHVGREVEKVCSAMGMNILRNDPPRAAAEGEDGFASLQTIAEEADIITLHTPLTKSGEYPTYHLIDQHFVGQLKKSPWLLNSCRGAVHDTRALMNGFDSGEIASLMLDCWENEPYIDRQLLAQTAIATPHIAGFSADGKANATRMCLEHISSFYQIKIDKIAEVIPPEPRDPVIDLNRFARNRIEQAIFHSFDPLPIDLALRAHPEQFESFRANYNHHREFSAYTIKNATPEEAFLLRRLGFK